MDARRRSARPTCRGPTPYCPADAAGGGECPINFCGQLKVGLPSEPVPAVGRRFAVRRPRLQGRPRAGLERRLPADLRRRRTRARWRSAPPARRIRRQAMRCADDSLCIAAADFPGSPFCRTLCRNDADCPSDGALPRVPDAGAAGRPARDDRDVHAGVEDRRHGLRARGRLPGGAGLRPLRRAHQPARSAARGGTKSLGTACAAATECRSGECYDRDFHVSGGQNRALLLGRLRT